MTADTTAEGLKGVSVGRRAPRFDTHLTLRLRRSGHWRRRPERDCHGREPALPTQTILAPLPYQDENLMCRRWSSHAA